MLHHNYQLEVNYLKYKYEKKIDRVYLLAYDQNEALYLAVSGNLEGKYVYSKTIVQKEAYIKKCSSILGQSYVTDQSSVFLIADKLDLNIFFNPDGAYKSFKKSASTKCKGSTPLV